MLNIRHIFHSASGLSLAVWPNEYFCAALAAGFVVPIGMLQATARGCGVFVAAPITVPAHPAGTRVQSVDVSEELRAVVGVGGCQVRFWGPCFLLYRQG